MDSCEDKRPAETPIVRVLRKWITLVDGKSQLRESNLEQSFNEDIFIKILGYSMPPLESFNFLPKQHTIEEALIPDFLMGSFRLKEGRLIQDVRRVVGELKGPNKSLDQVDPARKKTPVEQAWEYAKNNGIYVEWIIVSNVKTIRLYRNTSVWDYEEFRLKDFVSGERLTPEFWRFYFLLHFDFFLKDAPKTPVYNLLLENLETRVKLTESFYKHYREILLDAYHALAIEYPQLEKAKEGQMILAQSAQKLLHRGLLICFMSDHPHRLLPKGILSDVIEAARSLPVLSKNKIYSTLKDFFRCVDQGSPKYYPFEIFGYDGSLFVHDQVLDSVELPDSLFEKKYDLNGKELTGIFGFRAIDFYYEFSPHLLGRLFEYSVNDQEQMLRRMATMGKSVLESLNLQGELGVVYTREVLANFAGECVLSDMFQDIRKSLLEKMFSRSSLVELNETEEVEFWKAYVGKLLGVKIVDLSVGSGAFLVACYNLLKQEISNAFEMRKLRLKGLHRYMETWESSLLEESLYGEDIMPDAISVAKLALWLASVRKNVPLKDFQKNFVVGDSLDKPIPFSSNLEKEGENQLFDIVIGNPPWGAQVSKSAIEYLRKEIPDVEKLDSYELFLHIAIRHLKEGGRLCYIQPHTLLYPEKEKTRRFLVDNFKIERWHYLGSDWFGKDIRMNTTVLQLKKEKPRADSKFISMTLVDEDRKGAIEGRLDLKQLEKSYAFQIPQGRSQNSPSAAVELFRYVSDDPVLGKMESNSIQLSSLCKRGRGIELNKAGEVVQCPGCGRWITPPSPMQNIPKEEWPKKCNLCGHEFLWKEALATHHMVSETDEYDVPYIDGDSFNGRYKNLTYKSLKLGYNGIDYKQPKLYEKPKIFIRQAGVGLSVAYDEKGAYCPQSVYVYRIRDEPSSVVEDKKAKNANGYPWSEIVYHKFLLAILQSRTLAYYVFKKFGEIDASQAFSKLTHARLGGLPIPVANYREEGWKEKHARIVELVEEMLSSGSAAYSVDWEIERIVQQLYGLNPSDAAYISSQLGLVAYHQAMKQMFPSGPPPKPKSVQEIKIKCEHLEKSQD